MLFGTLVDKKELIIIFAFMKKISFIFLLFFSQVIFSQDLSQKVLQEYEDTLSTLAHTIMYGENETIRFEANKGFVSELLEVLKYNNSYNYPFDSLKSISILHPDDHSFRLFNWIIRKDDGEIKYHAYVVLPSVNEKKNIIIQLQDNSDYQLDFENQIFTQDNWYGALYYKIISPKKKYNKFYTLLAWDGNSKKSVKKIIEILEIKDREIYFGKNIFIKNNQKSNRVEIEYNSNTSVSVNYDESKNRIIFDHLVPLKENQEGFKAFYVPDGSYDCYQYKNGKWFFKEDIDVRSKIIFSKKSNSKEEKGLFRK